MSVVHEPVPTATGPGAGPTRRRALVLAAAVVLVWLVAGAVAGTFTSRLAEVQENDNAAFLPESAESTRVAEQVAAFTGDDTLPAVVVWESADGPVSPALAQAAGRAVTAAGDLPGTQGAPVGPFPSEDGEALQAVVPLQGELGGEELVETVTALRGLLGSPPGGEVLVTGPAGTFADFGEAFGAIDGLLLAVALGVVLVILLVVYRSPLLPLLVIVNSLLALAAASAVVYALTRAGVLDLNGQSQGILFILVVGAATDYALLLVARVREELRSADRVPAVATALRRTVEPVLASGGTVVLGVLCLLVSELSSTASLGPVAATGVVFAVLASLTFLPAVLVLLGRTAFWPFRPQLGSTGVEERGLWGRVARAVARRPRPVWVAVTAGLVGLCLLAPRLDTGAVAPSDVFLADVDSVAGSEALARHFPTGAGQPALVLGDAEELPDLLAATTSVPDVAGVLPVGVEPTPAGPRGSPTVVDGSVLLQATLDGTPSQEAEAVAALREAARDVDPDALVGGSAAIEADTLAASSRDLRVIVPLVLLVIGVVLALLLRSLLAPALLVVTVVLSFGATIGVASVVFADVLDLPGVDPSIPLYAFVFLGALGIDYNIFLMTRLREEAQVVGTRAATVKALGVTGGVITSAGVVLAATFGTLAVLPILFLLQIAFLVAFGVLLDTFVVRGLLVPALVHDLGRVVWWPSRLARSEPDGTVAARGAAAADPAADPEADVTDETTEPATDETSDVAARGAP